MNYPANPGLWETVGKAELPSHGGNPGSNPGSGTSEPPSISGVSSFWGSCATVFATVGVFLGGAQEGIEALARDVLATGDEVSS